MSGRNVVRPESIQLSVAEIFWRALATLDAFIASQRQARDEQHLKEK
jgi:hypothetical protein